MNLQINSPYKPCPYRCPYCCAAYEGEKSLFQDCEKTALYFTNKAEYMSRLTDAVHSIIPDTIVITGSTEPTLFPEWIHEVLIRLIHCNEPGTTNVEITTRNTKFAGFSRMQAVTYSFDKIPNKVYKSAARNTRAVFILHDNISIDDIINYHRHSGGQTTVKNMAANSYGNATINEWIKQHRVMLPKAEIDRLTAEGIRYDHDCNNAEGRYMIFRADGNLYDSWQAHKPVTHKEANENV